MLLLDWEKAFDKLTHEALFIAMEKMNIDKKLIRLVKMLYKNPEFMVETEGKQSKWKKQKASSNIKKTKEKQTATATRTKQTTKQNLNPAQWGKCRSDSK